MSSKSYRDLVVWQKAMELAAKVYELTRTLPREELYCLVTQLRRAAISIASNIAEGQGRQSKEFLQFLRVARGSLNELETQLELAAMLAYINTEQRDGMQERTEEVGRLLRGLARSLTR
jgi:four helix bundle protein